MSYSVELGFAWLRVGKAGTRSLHHLLRNEVADYVYLTKWDRLPPEALALLSGEGFRFAIVRNPWDRLLSAWRQKIAGRPDDHKYIENLGCTGGPRVVEAAKRDYPSFVRLLEDSTLIARDPHFQPQTEILGDVELDFIGRFEQYGEAVEHALGLVGLGHLAPELEHRNRTSTGEHYSRRYDDETRETVTRLYATDIARWGYSFDEVSVAVVNPAD